MDMDLFIASGLLFTVLCGIEAWRKTKKEEHEIERLALSPPQSAAEVEIREQIKFWRERYEDTGYYPERDRISSRITELTTQLIELTGEEEKDDK